MFLCIIGFALAKFEGLKIGCIGTLRSGFGTEGSSRSINLSVEFAADISRCGPLAAVSIGRAIVKLDYGGMLRRYRWCVDLT